MVITLFFWPLMVCFMNCQPGWGDQQIENRWNRANSLHGRLNQSLRSAMALRRSEDDLINLNVGGPKRDPYYNPSIGYEPYWIGGDWVLPVFAPEGGACGKVCSQVYKDYGVVCGWNKKLELKTFENYCMLKNADCDGTKGWLVAYRGECQPEIRTYPTRAREIVSRASYWVENFSAQPYVKEICMSETENETTTAPTITEMRSTRTKLYRPNFGYEPYWPGGEWVLLGDASGTTPKVSTVPPPMVCGHECHYLYRPILETCGRLVSNIEVLNDNPGIDPDNFTVGYETFPTFCTFLHAQCSLHKTSKGKEAYVFVRNGSCDANQHTYFQPFHWLDNENREKLFVSDHSEDFKNLKWLCLRNHSIKDKTLCRNFDLTIDEKYTSTSPPQTKPSGR